MLHGSPTRSGHRAAAGGLALLVRRPSPRPPATTPSGAAAPRQRSPEPQRAWQCADQRAGRARSCSAVCGLIGFFIVVDERATDAPAPVGEPPPSSAASAPAGTDPEPLTAGRGLPGRRSWSTRRAGRTGCSRRRSTADCARAATGELGAAARRARLQPGGTGDADPPTAATWSPPASSTWPTRGRRWTRTSRSGRWSTTGEGRFRGLRRRRHRAGRAGVGPQVGWHVRGHYLVYSVIARADGRPIAAATTPQRRRGSPRDLLELVPARGRCWSGGARGAQPRSRRVSSARLGVLGRVAGIADRHQGQAVRRRHGHLAGPLPPRQQRGRPVRRRAGRRRRPASRRPGCAPSPGRTRRPARSPRARRPGRAASPAG